MNVKEMLDLNGKIALVSGGYGLYGKHISSALCEAGAQVIIASRNIDRCLKYAEKLKTEGYKADGMELDLSDQKSIQNLEEKIISEYGQLDILVNNAVARAGGDLETMTVEQWEKAQKVNSTGLFLINKIFVTQMVKQGYGNIINISSIQGVTGPHFPIYKNTDMTSPVNYTYDKWGMVGLTKWMANYYGKYNIRVNCISPGGYYNEQPEEFVKRYNEQTPLKRMADDDDIKGPVVFLASDASKYITGHNLVVDGGWTCW